MISTKRGFTFVELLVVIAILATLAAILVLILNPAEYLRRARDAQRLSDYTRIGQAMNLYAYSAALGSQDQDFDGPVFPTTGSPPITDSCINDPIPHRIFVSVPSDNGESDPTPPADWTYRRVQGAQLRAVDGTGWFPVDFTEAGAATAPFSALPVDPVNTFASGYYYSYACGSYEMNLRFESEKYQELAATDNGNDAVVYETGTKLDVLPEQPAYHPTSTAGVVSGTLVLNPFANGVYASWSPTGGSAYTVVSDENNDTYISASTLLAKSNFTAPPSIATGTINEVRLVIHANQTDSVQRYKLKPFLRLGAADIDNSGYLQINPIFHTGSTFNVYSTTIPGSWTWADINNLQIGVVVDAVAPSGVAKVSKLFLEVDYQ